ncbi:hypothetical protein BY996DRAFT_4576559 [Phakopsora pachyrhizi]|nr:hypothetical protein BY996DRAFT_4576559 [Phakopsora pachyrhizi]
MKESKLKVIRGLDPSSIPEEFKNLNIRLREDSDDGSMVNDQTNYLNLLIKSLGDNSLILLSKGSVWELNSRIVIDFDNVEIATEGSYPVEPELQAQIHTIGKYESTAISFQNTKNVKLSNLLIDGKMGLESDENGFIQGGGALISCGGRSCKNPIIQFCTIRNPRSWSCLHVFDYCEGARIVNNKIGPAGFPAPKGPWADGLSIACKNGLISNNQITDATDGAIVLFCAPGTLCVGNKIIAKDRNLLGGINLVDHGPYGGDYKHTRVLNNQIISTNAHIKLGIGIGPITWSPNWTEINKGGKVFDNLIGPGRFGYGIGMSGCKNFKVEGNRIADGTQFVGDMSKMPAPLNAPPMAFLRSNEVGSIEDCKIQDDFIPGRATWLIGLEDGNSKMLSYESRQINLLSTDQAIDLQRIKINLEDWGELRVIDRSSSEVLWSSGTRSSVNKLSGCDQFNRTRLGFDWNGNLTIREVESGRLIWNPMGSLDGCVEIGDGVTLTVSDVSPFLLVRRSCGSVVWASEYIFERGQLELKAGQFISVTPEQSLLTTGPPPIPPRIGVQVAPPPPIPSRPNGTTVNGNNNRLSLNCLNNRPMFIYLDPNTSNLIIHNGDRYDNPFGRVIWASELFSNFPRQVPSKSLDDDSKITKCVFQGGDGNLVTYANPNPNNDKERCAIWASGTCECEKIKIFRISDERSLSMTVEMRFLNGRGEVIKKIP